MADSARTVRVIQHIACSGGTIMTHALAALPGVAVASEIHPSMGMRKRVNPFCQFRAAYPDLIGEADLDEVFRREVAYLDERCAANGMTLLVRDHTSADFLESSTFDTLRTPAVLGQRFDVRRIITVRHPVDCWLGMTGLGWMNFGIREYCARFLRFATFAEEAGFVRYEDFTEEPNAVVRRMTEALDIPFDPSWRSRMAEVGDHLTGRSGRSSLDIAPRPRRPIRDEDLAAFEAEPAYRRALEVLGYDHPVGLAA